MQENETSIGIFDSGVGGLSVLKEIRILLPSLPVFYFADQGHIPYGSRELTEIQAFSASITRFLLARRAKLIVVACNAASAAALLYLRQNFPAIPFVGMEPAVKPAAESTRTGRVGILATPATFQGKLYASVVERFASGVTILQDTCPGLVSQIEKGDLTGRETQMILENALLPMKEQGIDTVVLGCTHYPFVIPLIKQIVGPDVRVIDPAPAVARQVARVLDASGLGEPERGLGGLQFFTSGDAERFEFILPVLFGEKGHIRRVTWAGNELDPMNADNPFSKPPDSLE